MVICPIRFSKWNSVDRNNIPYINSSPPSAAHIRHWSGLVLVQIMACRLFGAKQLSKPMLGYCQLDPQEQTSVKFESIYKTFHSRKCNWKYRLPKWQPFCLGEDELILSYWMDVASTLYRTSSIRKGQATKGLSLSHQLDILTQITCPIS